MSTVRATNFQHASAAAPAIVLAANGSATANVSSINNGPLAGMRNAIINGNFDFWQRGTGAFGNGYLADRWNAFLTTGSSYLQERYTLTDAQRDVIGYDAQYAWSGFSDATSSVSLVQPIEGVRTFAYQQVAVSFWAFVASGTCTISGSFIQAFGTGGSPSSNVTTNFTLSTTTVTTTPTKITGTVTLPSISGKVLGSAGNDGLVLAISKALGVAVTLRITGVQVEAGPVATPFERRPIGMELALCQRYFCKSYNVNVDPGTIANEGKYEITSPVGGGTLSIGTVAIFPVTMRNNPTVTVYNPITGASNSMRRDSVNVTPTIQNEGSVSVSIRSSSGASATAISFHYTASAEL